MGAIGLFSAPGDADSVLRSLVVPLGLTTTSDVRGHTKEY